MGLGTRALQDLIAPEALKIAAAADAVVVSVGFHHMFEAEGKDRSFALPWGQEALINAVAAANPKTIVNVTAGGGFETQSWLPHAAGLLDNFYPGQEGGRALAQLLTGEYSPEGRLPISLERRWEDNPVHDSYYPNVSGGGHENDVKLMEGLMVGYRYYTTRQKPVLFPFGFGLSSASFRLSGLRVPSAHVNEQSLKQTPLVASVEIANTGRIPAAEVVQLCVSNTSCKNGCPARELRGFAKVRLAPGESRRVESRSHTGPSRTSMWPRTTGAWILANTSSMRARRQKSR